ncbi:DUF4422 domain-containing protein [Lachnospiraceae bacterium ZAX-1]
MSTKIFTMTHKKFTEPKDTLYQPLHVGRALSSDLGYLGDDSFDCISKLNPYYGELTGIYWVWKNFHEADNVGICHYRRFFLNKDKQLLKETDYENILKEYDIMVSNTAYTDGSYQDYYSEAHNLKDLLTTGQVLKEKYPDYYPSFTKALAGHTYYYGNLLVTCKEKFDAYATWMFDILFEVEKRIDVSAYDLYNQRVFGFLSEQLLKVWIDKNELHVYEGIVGITAEKAETVEFKLAISQLLKMGEITKARQFFYEFTKIRPDVRLELSDIKGEIPIIEQILYICEEEQNRMMQGMYAYSKNLNELMAHYKAVRDIMITCGEQDVAEEEIKYILDNHVSWVFIMVILINTNDNLIKKAIAVKVIKDIFRHAGKKEDALMLKLP